MKRAVRPEVRYKCPKCGFEQCLLAGDRLDTFVRCPRCCHYYMLGLVVPGVVAVTQMVRQVVDRVGGIMSPHGMIDGEAAVEAVEHIQERFGDMGNGFVGWSAEDAKAIRCVVWVLMVLVSERL